MSNFNNNNSMFFNSRISSLIREYLVRNGISEDKIPADMSSKEFLINNLISKGIFNAPALVDGAINYAFDKKYFKYYSLEKDVHEYSDDWITDFHLILKKLNLSTKLNDLTMLNVGCNDGSQMKKLIGNNYKDIYLVDVGIRALQLAKEIFPNSIIINTNADILYGIPKNSIDLYLSFRTYNSSFFNIEGAISELNRVLCNNNAVYFSNEKWTILDQYYN